MREKGLRRTVWFSLCVPLGAAGGAQKLVEPLRQLVLEGVLRAAENTLVVRMHYGDQAIPSWVRWVLPDPKALCLHPNGAYESP